MSGVWERFGSGSGGRGGGGGESRGTGGCLFGLFICRRIFRFSEELRFMFVEGGSLVL